MAHEILDKKLKQMNMTKINYGVINSCYSIKNKTLNFSIYVINNHKSLSDYSDFQQDGIYLDYTEIRKSPKTSTKHEFKLSDYFDISDAEDALKAISLYLLSSRTLFKMQCSQNMQYKTLALNIRDRALGEIGYSEISIDTQPSKIDIQEVFQWTKFGKKQISANVEPIRKKAPIEQQPKFEVSSLPPKKTDTANVEKPFANLM